MHRHIGWPEPFLAVAIIIGGMGISSLLGGGHKSGMQGIFLFAAADMKRGIFPAPSCLALNGSFHFLEIGQDIRQKTSLWPLVPASGHNHLHDGAHISCY